MAYRYRGLPVIVGDTDALYLKARRIGFTLCIKNIKEQKIMKKYKFVHVLKLNNKEVRSMAIRGKPMQGTYRENIIINL